MHEAFFWRLQKNTHSMLFSYIEATLGQVISLMVDSLRSLVPACLGFNKGTLTLILKWVGSRMPHIMSLLAWT